MLGVPTKLKTPDLLSFTAAVHSQLEMMRIIHDGNPHQVTFFQGLKTMKWIWLTFQVQKSRLTDFDILFFDLKLRLFL